MSLFRDLKPAEDAEFRAWARKNYRPFDWINPVWRPAVVDECGLINKDEERKEALHEAECRSAALAALREKKRKGK